MPSKLMVVEAAFQLEGRLVLAPGVTAALAFGLQGATVRLLKPDGTVTTAAIISVEMLSPNRFRLYPIGFGLGITKNDVPPGTEVWTT